MKKKNGFISTTLEFSFFGTVLLLLTFLLSSYARTDFLLEEYKKELKDPDPDPIVDEPDEPNIGDIMDINLYIYAKEDEYSSYKLVDKVPDSSYTLENNLSFCADASICTDESSCMDESNKNLKEFNKDEYSIALIGDKILVSVPRRAICKVYIYRGLSDINLRFWVNDIDTEDNINDNNFVVSADEPTGSYTYLKDKLKCSTLDGVKLDNPSKYVTYDTTTKSFTLESDQKIVCDVYFLKNNR